jgi:murein L,D-transpeptidase YcbB/YkuD
MPRSRPRIRARLAALEAEAERSAVRARRPAGTVPADTRRSPARSAVPNSAVREALRQPRAQAQAVPSGQLQRFFTKEQVGPMMGGTKGTKQQAGMASAFAMIQRALYEMRLTRRGDRGIDVIILQSQLNWLGASPKLAVDGIFGPKTQRAVRMFQKGHGLDPDGIVGMKTRGALRTMVTVQATVAAVRQALGTLNEFRKRAQAFAG